MKGEKYMKILYNEVNHLISFIAPRIEKGIYDDPDVEKWGYYDEEGNLGNLFFVGADLTTATINEEDIPEDYQPMDMKYFFIDGEFVSNPDWQPPKPPIEERVSTIEDNITNIELALTDIVDLLA